MLSYEGITGFTGFRVQAFPAEKEKPVLVSLTRNLGSRMIKIVFPGRLRFLYRRKIKAIIGNELFAFGG